MKHKSLTNKAGYLLFLMLMSIAYTQPVLAICVQSSPNKADVVLRVDANNGCDSINGHYGCTIDKFNKNGEGNCPFSYFDEEIGEMRGFTLYVQIDPITGGMTWNTTQVNPQYPVGVDNVIVGGGFQSNNCGYMFEDDVFGSTEIPYVGAGGDCKVCTGADCNTEEVSYTSCETFQNITSVDACSDLVNELPPPPTPKSVPLPKCQDLPDGKLDETGVNCPTTTDPVTGKPTRAIVCNFEVDKYAFGTIAALDENDPDYDPNDPEQVCCVCGIETQYDCFISSEKADPDNLVETPDGLTIDTATGCVVEATFDPTQEVILQFQKDRGDDPCEKITSGGKVYKTCW